MVQFLPSNGKLRIPSLLKSDRNWWTGKKNQVSRDAIFNFKEEMHRYYSKDVEVICLCVQQFRSMSMSLQTLDGWDIGVDAFEYIAIAAVAFQNIYIHCFFPEHIHIHD